MSGRPVADMVIESLPNTALLAVSAILLAILFGIPLGALSAVRPGRIADQLIAFLSVGFVSAPSFFRNSAVSGYAWNWNDCLAPSAMR